MAIELVGALASGAAVLLAVAATAAPAAPSVGHPERSALEDTRWRHSTVAWELVRLGCAAAGAVVGVSLAVHPLPAAALGALAPSLWLRARAGRARDLARDAMPALLAAIHGALASGSTLAEALRRAVDGCDDRLAARPIDEALEAFALGDALDAALRRSAARSIDSGGPILGTFALGVAERLPIASVATLAGELAERARFEVHLAAEVRARTSSARAQVWVLAALVPVLSFYLAATVPALRETLTSALGVRVLLPAAFALELAGLVIARRIVRAAGA